MNSEWRRYKNQLKKTFSIIQQMVEKGIDVDNLWASQQEISERERERTIKFLWKSTWEQKITQENNNMKHPHPSLYQVLKSFEPRASQIKNISNF